MQENMPRTAYLVAFAFVDPLGNMLPQVHRVGIFSEGALSLSGVGGTRIALDVCNARGDTYESARFELMQTIEKSPHLAWCRPLMEKR